MSEKVDRYGWTSTSGPISCNYLAPAIQQILRPLAPRRVLDLGCGNGALARELSTSGYQVVGMDADAEGIQRARSMDPKGHYYVASFGPDGERALSSEGAFDAVISTEVIEHLYSPHELPRFAARVLRDGGYLVISTPYHGYLKNLALSLANKWDAHFTALWHGGHIKFWSVSTLSSLLHSNGFDVVAIKGVGRFPFLWKSMVLTARLRERMSDGSR